MKNYKGKFITLEGCEGVGKSRQLAFLKEYMTNNGIDFVVTREPGGGKISEKIREIILDGNNKEMTNECEALLYAAARVQHLNDIVEPALKQGKLVLCDRYLDSSYAYQAYARGLGMEFVEKINSYAIENFTPDYTIFLDLSPEEAFKRKGGVDKNDRLELSGFEFHQKVYEGYLAVAKNNPDRVIRIDPTGTKEETHAKIVSALKEKGIF
jgi:dTMP kinase